MRGRFARMGSQRLWMAVLLVADVSARRDRVRAECSVQITVYSVQCKAHSRHRNKGLRQERRRLQRR